MLELCTRPETDNDEARMATTRLDHPRTNIGMSAPGPPHDVVSIGEQRAQLRLTIAVPQKLAPYSASHGTSDNPPHRHTPRHVKPDQHVRPTGQQVTSG